jgi:hypothetical protein
MTSACVLVVEPGDELVAHDRREGAKARAVGEATGDVALFDLDGLDRLALDLREEVAVGELGRLGLGLPQHRDEEQDHHEDDHPQRHVPIKLLIHERSPMRLPAPAIRRPSQSSTDLRAGPEDPWISP